MKSETTTAVSTATEDTASSSPKTSKTIAKSNDRDPLNLFFLNALKDILWAEKALTEALPKMRTAATTEALKDAFEDHELQTRKHISRLEKIFSLLGQKAEAKKCDAMTGLIKEGEHVIESTPEGSMTRDAALIIAAQKVEHYEIASYGGLIQLALTLDHEDVAEILERTLQEEEDTDNLLTDIAEGDINFEAGEEH
ncbi:YciE/YciF ferroxidase family protein [Taibaiella koreensis]|uniref:YciE/YciF ferroxidase family protein n=1 Tax=Taibaiella koreensis TaxID=1268548 RepID=UPI000E59F6A7|nr:ferritin-like domain-containing protein [Taibaiella koreensis]